MSSAVKVAASILLISLLGVPMSYIVNTAQITQGELGLLASGVVCLGTVVALTYLALRSFQQPIDWLFYGK